MKKLSITGAESADARTVLKVSQAKASSATGIRRTYISEFENGLRKLPKEENEALREYYEKLGYTFDNSKSEAVSRVIAQAEDAQLQVGQSGADEVKVQAIDLSDLLAGLGDALALIEPDGLQGKSSTVEDFQLELENPSAYAVLSEKFEQSNDDLMEYFALDEEGSLPAPGFLSSREGRANKIIALLALQQIRYMAMKNGVSVTNLSSLKDIQVFKGKDSAAVQAVLGEMLETSTVVDEHLDKVA